MIVVSHSAGFNGVIIFNGVGNQDNRFLNSTSAGGTHSRIEFETEQDSGNPTDAYRFRWKLLAGSGTYSYAVIR